MKMNQDESRSGSRDPFCSLESFDFTRGQQGSHLPSLPDPEPSQVKSMTKERSSAAALGVTGVTVNPKHWQ